MQTGMGVDVHGEDATKACQRAIDQAIRHNSLTGLGQLILEPKTKTPDWSRLRILVTIGCPFPQSVNHELVRNVLPYGTVELEVKEGGLLPETGNGDTDHMLIAVAAVLVIYLPSSATPGQQQGR